MKISQRHPWVLTAEAAVPIQQTLAQEIITQDQLNSVQYVAGVDVGFKAGVYFCRSSHQPGNRDRLRHALYHRLPETTRWAHKLASSPAIDGEI